MAPAPCIPMPPGPRIPMPPMPPTCHLRKRHDRRHPHDRRHRLRASASRSGKPSTATNAPAARAIVKCLSFSFILHLPLS